MRERFRRRIAAALGMGLLLGITAAVVAGAGPGAASPFPLVIHGQGWSPGGRLSLPRQPEAAGQSQVFYISGAVGGVYPGSSSTLTLSIQNPLNIPITVSTITLVAGSPSSACPSSMLMVPPGSALNTTYTINTSLAVPANSTVAGPSVTLSLATAATNACAGVSFPLMYGGTASG